MSIKFPDLQVLFPRSHDTSRMEQAGQKHSEIVQAQLGSPSGQELTVRRNQVNAAEKKQYGRVEERDSKGRRHPPDQHQGRGNSEERQKNSSRSGQRGLGSRIDIRI